MESATVPAAAAVIDDRCVSVRGLSANVDTSKGIPEDTLDSREKTTNRQSSKLLERSRLPLTFSPISPSMALKMSFADWRQASSENMLATAETLLDELESVAELLTQIDERLITAESRDGNLKEEQTRDSIVQRFHEGVESARGVVGALKREKWRLSKREMSVELKMGELEEYKSHLKNDMSSLNQTVDVLSLRIIQLENQLVEAQEVQETLEAELTEHKKRAEQAEHKWSQLQKENGSLMQDLKLFTNHTSHTLATENALLRNEILILQDENKRLKELVRNAESHPTQLTENGDDLLARLTRDFLKQLSNIENEDPMQKKNTEGELSHVIQPTGEAKQNEIQVLQANK